ncbi:Ecp15 [Fulvia fulva]|uniref:Ecp15 n=1 Tax=Passalora fulva TaxID=5499 RepID=A0A1P8YXM2_PASFU|nr:Ecp15 [Fulvia fulva]AQA29262.1 extracellular protein 15 [Fulvia fulva]KAK4621669.1 Ecp15 [Fulvia fulva]KAK4622413.1 Ecp15 [Fulvia fulva]UJO18797.1 Ecp15 [Fulvia fulva]WPV15893.1 Ecp15 [Fulvia fulva]
MAYLRFFIAATMLPASVLGAAEYAATFSRCPGTTDGVGRTWLPDDNRCAWLAFDAGPYDVGVHSPSQPLITYNSYCCLWDHGISACYYNTRYHGDINSKAECAQDTAPCAFFERHPGVDHGTVSSQARGTC